jgi:hypothetical protein
MMNQEHRSRAELGLQAMRRAARKVAEDARKNGYAIPYWIDGRVQYIIPGPDVVDENDDPNSTNRRDAIE